VQILHISLSQGSVVTVLRCGRGFSEPVASLLLTVLVKVFLKSIIVGEDMEKSIIPVFCDSLCMFLCSELQKCSIFLDFELQNILFSCGLNCISQYIPVFCILYIPVLSILCSCVLNCRGPVCSCQDVSSCAVVRPGSH